MFNNKPLIVFEMANNHMGDMGHALRMIDTFGKYVNKYPEFDFFFKFQFRDIPTFIHPDYKDRMDVKYVKRFAESALNKDQFATLCGRVRSFNMKVMATPFDESSVALAEELDVDIVKVASCSCGDWPLLERIVKVDKPIVFSTAGASFDTLDKIVSFFQHRDKKFAVMHCVGEYPTAPDHLQVNQITQLKERYPGIPVGFSTHEDPGNYDAVFVAVGKGAQLFEKHVTIDTDKYPRNAYSATPEEVETWLDNARKAHHMLGVKEGRHPISEKEKTDLRQFQRGVFVNRDLDEGYTIRPEDLFYAWPCKDGQMVANDLSKYKKIKTLHPIAKNGPVLFEIVEIVDNREEVNKIVQAVKALVKKADVMYPGGAELEISHHYGIENFYETGITMVTVVNREYCKKLIAMLPNQNHPEQYHRKKEETFYVLYGDMQLYLNGEHHKMGVGDVITIQPEVRHSFKTKSGCVVEEISSTHYKDDSYYTDGKIGRNQNRKTLLKYWL